MGRTLNGVTDGNEGEEQFAVWIAHQEEIKVEKGREEMELFEWGCWMQNLSGRNSKCWGEAGWVWVMQQIFFSPKLCKADAATTHLRNLSCNRCRKNDPRARSCLQQRDKTSSSVLLSLAQVGWDLNGFEWHLRDFTAHHDKGSYCLPPNSLTAGIHRSSKNPNFCSFHTNFPSTVIFSKYSLLVTFWIPCNL